MSEVRSTDDRQSNLSVFGELPKILESPFNISATAEASDFKFGMQPGFAKGHHKITPQGISGRGPGLGKLPKTLKFPFNISVMAEGSDFKFGKQLRFAKAHHKITPKEKWAWHWARGAPQNFVVPLQYLHNG